MVLTLDEAKALHTRHNKPWSAEEEREAMRGYGDGKPIKDIAANLQRSVLAVSVRIRILMGKGQRGKS